MLPPQPHPWNGKGDFESIWGLGVSCHMFHQVVVVWMLWVVCCGGCRIGAVFVRSAPSMRGPTWWVTGTAGKLKCPKVFPSQPLQTQICTYKMVHLLKRWFLYRMASWFFFVNDYITHIFLKHQIIPLKTSTKLLFVCYKMVCLGVHKSSCLQNKNYKTM